MPLPLRAKLQVVDERGGDGVHAVVVVVVVVVVVSVVCQWWWILVVDSGVVQAVGGWR